MRSEGGQQRSERRNLLFEQGEECPGGGPRYAGRTGGGARPEATCESQEFGAVNQDVSDQILNF